MQPEHLSNGWLWVLLFPFVPSVPKRKHTCDIHLHKSKTCCQLTHRHVSMLLGHGRGQLAAIHLHDSLCLLGTQLDSTPQPLASGVGGDMWLSSGQWDVGITMVLEHQTWASNTPHFPMPLLAIKLQRPRGHSAGARMAEPPDGKDLDTEWLGQTPSYTLPMGEDMVKTKPCVKPLSIAHCILQQHLEPWGSIHTCLWGSSINQWLSLPSSQDLEGIYLL